MMVKRKIIFETKVGSHLYGTNRPDSDDDFCGVFLPSTNDLLGLQNCPTEWSENIKHSKSDRNSLGDVDRKYYSVQRFLKLLSEGQSLQIEMLFAEKPSVQLETDEWQKIKANSNLFLSKSSIMPFIGFAQSQAYKATLKGENLNLIRNMIGFLSSCNQHDTLEEVLNGATSIWNVEPSKLTYVMTEGNKKAIEIAGRQYELNQQVRYVKQKLVKIEEKYGTRAEAASSSGYDFKSLLHAYRLLMEARILLTEGKLTFPLPSAQVELLKRIRSGEYQADYFQELSDSLTELRAIKDVSSLQEKPNFGKIEELCQEMLYQHLFLGR